MIGYSSTLVAWLGGQFAAPETDMSVTLQWVYRAGQEYLSKKNRDFVEEVRKKQIRFSPEDEKKKEIYDTASSFLCPSLR